MVGTHVCPGTSPSVHHPAPWAGWTSCNRYLHPSLFPGPRDSLSCGPGRGPSPSGPQCLRESTPSFGKSLPAWTHTVGIADWRTLAQKLHLDRWVAWAGGDMKATCSPAGGCGAAGVGGQDAWCAGLWASRVEAPLADQREALSLGGLGGRRRRPLVRPGC